MFRHHDETHEKNTIHNKQQEKSSLFMRLVKTKNSRAFRSLTFALAVIVVFGTSYSLILPAITVDQESAEEMPGIYMEEDAGTYDADYQDVYEDTYDTGNAADSPDSSYGEADTQTAGDQEYDQQDADEPAFYGDIPDDSDYDYEESDGDEWSEEDYTDDTTENAAAEDEADQNSVGTNDIVTNVTDGDEAAADSSYTFNETRMETMLPAENALLGDVTVRIDYNSSALIPDGSLFNAEEVNTWAETEEELEYKEWRLGNLRDTADALISDMDSDWSYHDAAFIDTELIDPEGNPGQPESDLYLTINFTNPLYTDKVEFVQFLYDAGTDSECPVILDPVDLAYTEDGGLYAGVFMVDTLSAFGVVCGDSLQALEEAREDSVISAISEIEYHEGEVDAAAEDSVEEDAGVESFAEPIIAESETEFAAEPVLTESETDSAAEPVLTESETDSAAEPVLTESETDSAAEAVLTDSFAEPVLDLALMYPAQDFKDSTDEVTVTVHAPVGAFPAGTTMSLKDVDENTIDDITEAVSDKKTVVKKVHAVDITFTDRDGNEIEPLAPVKMTMTSDKKQKTEETVVVHVSDEGNVEQVEQAVISERNGEAKARLTMEGSENGTDLTAESEVEMPMESEEVPVVEAASEAENAAEYNIEADAFSVYAIVYTVDFYWEVDGKIYTYSIPGGTAVNLKDLLPVIGVVSDDPDTEVNELDKFEKEIENVKFSDETLVKVAHPEKDITLKELKKELGIDTILSAAYVIDDNTDSVDDISLEDAAPMGEGAYYIDESAGDTAGLSFSAPETEPEENEEVSGDVLEEGDIDNNNEDVQIEDSDAQTDQKDVKAITILKDGDTIEAGSWVLISEQPFTSDETLTVSMEDGEVFTVKVTDEQAIAWDVWFDGTLGQGNQSNKFYNGANNIHTSVAKNPIVGSVTIRMPAVGESVYGSGGTTSVQAPTATGYNYVLNGWYDIRKGILYKPGDVVRITQDTVFYADWVPDSYNKGSSTGAINTPSTAGFVHTELFDYNELINTYGTSVSVDVGYPYGNIAHTDIWNSNSNFNFISWNYNGNPSYSIGMPGNLQEASQYRYDTLTKDIYANNQGFIERIFNPQEEMIGKTYVGTGDYLFNYNPQTGEYYYDSDKNGATYNQGDNRFYVYQNKEYILDNDETTQMTNFLPFNDQPGNYNNAPQQNTGRTDYWFGMKNTIDFYLPDDVDLSHGLGNKNPVSGEDMIFKFSGDDDVWVFVEDETGNRYQVMDLGGIHNRAGGFINFSTGEVTTFKGTIENRENVVVDPVATAALQNVKSGNCKLTVYYLERGSSLSNCSIYFNLEPQPKTLELSKRLEGLTDEERAKYTDEEFTYELIVNGEPYDSNPAGVRDPDDDRYYAIYYDKDGHEIKETVGGVEVVKKRRIINGQIKIKDGETVKIPRLGRFDTFYVAEEKGLNMNQFEIPHAERIYTDVNSAHHEEDVTLHRDHSAIADVDDWATPRYELQDTEKVTFTNTLRETELEVKKKWIDAEPKTSHPPIQFTVEATIEGANGEPERYKVDQLRDTTDSDKNKVFTLNTENGSNEAVYYIKQLPVVTSGEHEGKQITYTVSEVTVDDYTTTYETKETLQDIEVMKLWADNSHTQETIKVKLQRTSDGKYYSGCVNGTATFADSVEFTE